MARLSSLPRIIASSDDRGVVCVEFLIAFGPIFLLVLAVCQLALMVAAEAVVRHAAYCAVRSAIVVLDEPPAKFSGAHLGDLNGGVHNRTRNAAEVLRKLGVVSGELNGDPEQFNYLAGQGGARMLPITTAAIVPLLPLAPNRNQVQLNADSVSTSLVASNEEQLKFALSYTRLYAVVTLHDSPENDSMAQQPFDYNAPVTARVRYLFHCSVPLVRMLMCHKISVVDKSSIMYGDFMGNIGVLSTGSRVKVLTGKATMPNQGARYYRSE